MLNPLFARLGVDAVLVPVHATPERLAEVVRGLQAIGNLDGLLITVPHKIKARAFADDLSPSVEISGSTNAMRREPDGRWFAENFDGTGFVEGLRSQGRSPHRKRVSLVGAGGAGGAIAAAVLQAGAEHLSVCDHDGRRLDALVSRLAQRWPGRVTGTATPELEAVDIAVNATALGLRADDPLPFAPAALPRGTVVADVIMKPRETPLLRVAAALGHHPHHGSHMLTQQLGLYQEFFRLNG
ncbi:shikimate dehydrogenase [Streptomyces sp. CS014]|uniref:Shikimate dehydrogenase n=2 Tax=Streptomyces TaxID=1883 RepID=A0A5D4JM47_9ACTN|nr:shikimate dehydrogenase [Streptomyces sp. CS014]TYR66431.1 shikimate dehydrogenase [Streptomyces parvus]